MRAAAVVFGVLFLAGAAVQYNDPDPLRWAIIYLAAAITSFAAAFRSVPRSLPLAIGIGAIAWAATMAPQVLGRGEFSRMFSGWEMADTSVEEAREFWGLILIAAWMAVLAAFHRAARERVALAGSHRRR